MYLIIKYLEFTLKEIGATEALLSDYESICILEKSFLNNISLKSFMIEHFLSNNTLAEYQGDGELK